MNFEQVEVSDIIKIMFLLNWSIAEFVFIFILGLCVGSFLNVVIYRTWLAKGKGFVWGRSFCDHCKKTLKWFDNIPLLSYIALEGRCRFCRKKISLQYPLVEFATGLLFVFVWVMLGQKCISGSQCFLMMIFYCWMVAALVAVFVSDLRYRIIPDEVIFSSGLLILLIRLLETFFGFSIDFGGGILGAALSSLGAGLFFLILIRITKGKGMGMGDVKYVVFMGILLGWPKVLVGLFLAFLTGAVVGVILILTGRRHFGEQIAFGPYLSLATFIALFWGQQILDAYLKLL